MGSPAAEGTHCTRPMATAASAGSNTHGVGGVESITVRQLARGVPGWRMSAKAVPVMRAAMAAAFEALVMVQMMESMVVATELVREACCEEEIEEDSPPPPIPKQLSLALSPHHLLRPYCDGGSEPAGDALFL
jgi:hypothetical protein